MANLTPETLRSAAKQSERCHIVPLPSKSTSESSYGDIGLGFKDEETIAYVASRMPAILSACYRVLSEASQGKVTGFFSYQSYGSRSWDWLSEVWPKSLQKKSCKAEGKSNEICKELVPFKGGAFVVAPAMSFVEIWKILSFCSVAVEDSITTIIQEDLIKPYQPEDIPCEEGDPVYCVSDVETDTINDNDEEEQDPEEARADLGGGWGRIVFSPVWRGRQAALNVSRSNNRENSGLF
ncbi:hypothetical protein SADUNF_Sadunf03G0109200 [Salix dunnii]|uniref:Uncharacterized protein n=1 Tax=Salix dunnii TaxID=1413687 RepID=A0A835KEH3_9ROSI|nr:hypothetical protein SADUNF_Sadunf03G0109200 [Salix dunnii]